MAAVISYSGSRVTITGPYKSFLGAVGSTNTVLQYASGDAPAGGDAGRFLLWCKGGTTITGPWEVRYIASATGSSVTIDNPFSSAPGVGDTFRISSNIDDVLAAQPTAVTKTGDTSYFINGDMSLASLAFFAGVDKNLEFKYAGSSLNFPCANQCVLHFGRLWGGENTLVSYQTTQGCRINFNQTGTSTASVFSSTNGIDTSGPVLNFFGCLLESSVGGGYQFVRSLGPCRLIGCIMDGILAGRLYHPASELVDTRLSGLTSTTAAFSIGATFTRTVDNLKVFRNNYALKSYQSFSGTFRNVTFEDNTKILSREGDAGSTFTFIDCTEFAVGDTTNTGGHVNQYRSVNYTITDDAGVALPGATLRVNDNLDATQSAVRISDGSGICTEVLARRRNVPHGSTTFTNYYPFRIRIRYYGKIWAALDASIADKIKSSFAMLPNPYVTQASGVAAAHTGITLTDHGGSPVAWNGKNWGITITGDLTTNPALTIADIYHYLQWHLAQAGAFSGKASGDDWHNMLPAPYTATERANYGGTQKGVRIVDQAGNPFPGVLTFQSDDGTYYTPPVTVPYSITGLVTNSRVRIYNVDTATEIYNAVVGATSLSGNYTEGVEFTTGDTVEVRVAYVNGLTAKLPFKVNTIAGVAGWSVLAAQVDDDIYIANGIDGSLVTKFVADFVGAEMDLVTATDFTGVELYAAYVNATYGAVGIVAFFGGFTAIDQANYRWDVAVTDAYLNNNTATNVKQTDNVRLFRSDEAYPVRNPTTGGGGIDVVWRDRVYIAVTGSGVLPSDILAIADEVLNGANRIETGFTLARTIRNIAAATAGKSTGGPGSPVHRNQSDTADQVAGTADANGNRSAITYGS